MFMCQGKSTSHHILEILGNMAGWWMILQKNLKGCCFLAISLTTVRALEEVWVSDFFEYFREAFRVKHSSPSFYTVSTVENNRVKTTEISLMLWQMLTPWFWNVPVALYLLGSDFYGLISWKLSGILVFRGNSIHLYAFSL